MRSSHLFALLVGCFAILAGASPSISDYPPCAVACIIDALPQSPCSGLNQTCLCADPVFNEEVSGCVKQGCTVSEALNVANMTWADCGFPLTDNTAIPRYLTGFLFILPVTFISIRFLNKAISPTPWGADDACALAGFVSDPYSVVSVAHETNT
ncbi:hypothetical protein CGMCC3_g4409 [Colletotrichum fructicola]|nr:uncharacterized protein CGMCC3_g4409 [Colletotrichum fructicola]KAE9579566.1 hypothetical protein CGMCC3_g4409 [Colletotrichum fructicola]